MIHQRRYTRNSQRLRIRKIILVVGSIVILFCSILVLIVHLVNSPESLATGEEDQLTTGVIVSKFTWDNHDLLIADVGPNAINAGKDVFLSPGKKGSKGLNAGIKSRSINYTLPGSPYFDLEGMDISIDFNKQENFGSIFRRGNGFEIGLRKGFLTIKFTSINNDNETTKHEDVTGYYIPDDGQIRNIRFIFSPGAATAELFVNNLPAWSRKLSGGEVLWWEKTEHFIIGKGIGGNGNGSVIFDNFVCRTSISTRPATSEFFAILPESRIDHVIISCFAISEGEYILQRSEDGNQFTDIDNKSIQFDDEEPVIIEFFDNNPGFGITYYRIYKKHHKDIYSPIVVNKFSPEKNIDVLKLKLNTGNSL